MPIVRIGRLRELVVPYVRLLVPALWSLLGFLLLVETASFTTIGAAQGKKFKLFGAEVDPAIALPWLLRLARCSSAASGCAGAGASSRRVWDGLIADAKARGVVA